MGALANQRLALGPRARQLLPGRFEIRAGAGAAGGGHLALLAARFERFLTDHLLGRQLLVAALLGLGEGAARRGVEDLRVRGQHLGLRAPDRRLLRREALVEVDGVHLADRLTGLDPIAHLDIDAQHTTGHGRADPVGVAGFDCADTEQGRSDRLAPYLDHRHRHRRQRTGTQGDPDEECGERHQHRDQSE